MRKALLFVVAVAMVVGGLWLLGGELFVADRWHGIFVIGGAMLTSLGVYLLWADFIAPLLGIKGEEE
jgi:flagellar motor component MotA